MKRNLNGKVIILIAVLAATFVLTSCKPASNSYKNITAKELKQLLDNNEKIFLVDVHIPEQEHLTGTDLFTPFDTVGDNLGKFPEDKDAKIIVYCRSGNMSEEASAELVKNGYTDVSNLEGGIYSWQAAGYGL